MSQSLKDSGESPEHQGRWIEVGRILGPFGVEGAVKVRSTMTRPADLDQWATWWLGEDRSEKTEHRVLWCKTHSRGLVVRLEKIDDRDQAAGMAGKSIWVPRYQLPACDQDSYYWTDLVGMDVKDRSGRTLGRVDHLFETGAQDVMVIVGEFGQEVLIPFVADFVDAVDRNQGTIIVNPLPGMV